MFTWLNRQGVRSDQGFEVLFTGRFTLEYREGGHIVTIEVENGGKIDGVPSESVWGDAFDRLDGESPDRMNTDEEKSRLFANLRSALEFQGLTLVVLSRERDGITLERLRETLPKLQRGE